QGARHRRLAAAALADQPQRFAFANREIDAINGLDETGVSSQPEAAADGVMLDQPADVEDRCIARHRLRLRRGWWGRSCQINGHRTPLARGSTRHDGPAPVQPLAAGMRGTRGSPCDSVDENCSRWARPPCLAAIRQSDHTSELQSLTNLVCRLLLE